MLNSGSAYRALRARSGFVLTVALFISACSLTATAQSAAAPAGSAAVPSPRDITDTWQGTLHIAATNRDRRIVCKISTDDKGELKVVIYSIDQREEAVANAVFLEGGVLKYSLDLGCID